MVGVSGRIQTGSYTNKDGNKMYTTEVVANRVEFLSWGDNNGQGQRGSFQQQASPSGFDAPGQEQTQPQQASSSIPQGFEAIDDDDIPF